MELDLVNVTIGGEAGQGLVTVGELLSKSLARCGYDVLVTQSYMSRVRGGHNLYVVNGSTRPIQMSRKEIDILVAFDLETVSLHSRELAPGGVIVLDADLEAGEGNALRVPFSRLAGSRQFNIVALGVVAGVLGLDHRVVAETVGSSFGKKKPELIEQNLKALEEAYAWIGGQAVEGRRLADAATAAGRPLMSGNEAIALGALSAGLKFCSFYPMTPATSISLTVAGFAKRMGVIAEQAEDEIAAVNMAIGASYAGAPAMVATSGGGFALMTEGVSLAAMTETPLVIVVSQRPGPATGLPTRTEQADLEFVLYSGHGEFPRAIFAPGSVEECFHLTRKAFELAERYQSPVFLLTDQYLADLRTTIEPFPVGSLSPITAGADPAGIEVPYKRYRITESGVSPRLLPGAGEHLVVADSDEHCEFGHITEDLGIRKEMVDKRLRKSAGLVEAFLPPSYEGGAAPDLLLVSWGSSRGAVAEAAEKLRKEGREVAVLHFSQVWPLDPVVVKSYLDRARKVVCVEGNATGQLGRLICRETGFMVRDFVLRYDGLPLDAHYILERLRLPGALPNAERRV